VYDILLYAYVRVVAHFSAKHNHENMNINGHPSIMDINWWMECEGPTIGWHLKSCLGLN